MWVVSDQAVSSGTNFGLTVFVAHVSSAHDFGSFAFAITAGITVLSIVRGLAGDPLAAGFASADADAFGHAARQALSALFVLVAVVSVCVGASAAFLPDATTAKALMVLALVLPGVVAQDFVRSVYVIGGVPRSAFFNDLGWAVCTAIGYTALLSTGRASAAKLLLIWGVCGTLCALVGLLHLRLAPSWRSVAIWLRSTRHLWPYFLSDNAVLQVSLLATSSVVALTAGLGDVAGIRAVMVLFGLVIVMAQAGTLFAVPELARNSGSGRRVRRGSAVVGAVLATTAALVGVVAWLVPDDLGTEVLGETWRYAHPLIVFATIEAIGNMLILGCAIGLRATSAGKRVLRARLVTAGGRFVVCTIGAFIDGAYGALAMAAAFVPVFLIIWWRELLAATK